jgi:hypothetical protein
MGCGPFVVFDAQRSALYVAAMVPSPGEMDSGHLPALSRPRLVL